MRMNIGVVPAVREIYKNQFEFSLDARWLKFLRKVYPKCDIKFLSSKNIDKKFDLIIFSGGNDLVKNNKSKKNKIRKKIDDHYYKLGLKNQIPLIGICHGATYFGEKFGCKIKKKTGHVGNHKILLNKKNYFEKIKKI
jgi:GMP synthase-like glutamine amidotransferase